MNVWFDLSGLQTLPNLVPEEHVVIARVDQLFDYDAYRAGSLELADLGKALAPRIAAHPDRFMFGVDVFGPDRVVSEQWAATIPNYELFLDAIRLMGTLPLPESVRSKIRYGNAHALLTSRPAKGWLPVPIEFLPPPSVEWP